YAIKKYFEKVFYCTVNTIQTPLDIYFYTVQYGQASVSIYRLISQSATFLPISIVTLLS
ncbi:unnamed protein product, partial [marine sediment metagenome]